MKNEQLTRLAKLIDDLDANKYHLEAFILNQEYIKLAQTSQQIETGERIIGDEVADRALELAGGKKITEELVKKFPSKIKVNPGSALKGFGIGWLVDMGANYALDFFESSQGPYKVYQSNKSDLNKILTVIDRLISSSQISQLTNEIKDLADQGMKKFDEGKETIKTACKLNFRKVYNLRNQKLAIRGNFEEEMPEYLREFFTGALAGGAAGGIVGGPIGALVGSLTGGTGNILTKGAEDLWYRNISNTGKAYLQSKDLSYKVSKMSDALEQIDINLSNSLVDKSHELLKEIEKLNLGNKDKGILENLIQAIEEKIGSAGKFAKDKIQDMTGIPLNGQNGQNNTALPGFSSGSGIDSDNRRIL